MFGRRIPAREIGAQRAGAMPHGGAGGFHEFGISGHEIIAYGFELGGELIV